MLGTKLLLLLAPILLAKAQYYPPGGSGLSRRIPLRRPAIQPGPLSVTSAPVPISTEKMEKVKEPLPSKENFSPAVINPTISDIKPTELTIVYPENYKPAIVSSPPALSPSVPIRLPPRRPSPPIESTYVPSTISPSTFLPKFTLPPRSPPHFVSSVTSKPFEIATAIPDEPPSTELVTPLSTEKQPEIIVPPIKEIISLNIPKQPVTEEPSTKEPASKEPISEEPNPAQPISEEPIYEKPIIIEPIFQEPISTSVPTTSQPATTLASVPNRSLIVQPVYIEPTTTPVQEESIQSFADIVNPTVESSSSKPSVPSKLNTLVGDSSRPSRKPTFIWHAEPQKPRSTLNVPSTTEIYTNPPKITQKPQRPASTPKSLSLVDPFAIDRLHDYNCRNLDGYESIPNTCDSYVECKKNIAIQNTCPDGLHFNPAVKWPEYPCGYPSEVKCRSQDIIQEAKPSAQCPHRYGFYPLPGSDCGQYLMCQEGLATVMSCPSGLAFSAATSSCDWPSNVPGCNPLIFREYSCPPPTLDEYGQETFVASKFRYGNSCKQYVACQEGKPRLLSCDTGMSFDEQFETCVDADQIVNCTP